MRAESLFVDWRRESQAPMSLVTPLSASRMKSPSTFLDYANDFAMPGNTAY